MIAFLMTIENERVRNKLEEIYLTYYRDMFITAFSILQDHHEAEDMVQDAVLRLSKNFNKISDIKCKKTRSYLVIIVRNLSLNAYNKRKGIAMIEHDEVKRLPNPEELLIEEHMLRLDMRSEMTKYISQLHEPYADILMLRFYSAYDITEISEVLDITENNVSVRVLRALSALKKILEEEDVDYEQSI